MKEIYYLLKMLKKHPEMREYWNTLSKTEKRILWYKAIYSTDKIMFNIFHKNEVETFANWWGIKSAVKIFGKEIITKHNIDYLPGNSNQSN